MDYTYILVKDRRNSAEFYLRIGEKGSGYTASDVAIDLVIIGDDVCGKHTFYTTEDPIAFIKGLEMDYLYEKYGVEQVIDLDATISENLKKVMDARKCGNLSSEVAREYFDFLTSPQLSADSKSAFLCEIRDSLWTIDAASGFFDIHTKWSDRHIVVFDTLWSQFIDNIAPRKKSTAVLEDHPAARAIECQNCGTEFIGDEEIDALPYSRTTASGDHYKCSVCGEEI